jgi:hypothetical protein
MPKISEIRIAQYVKAAFNVLEENGDSLRARDVLAAVSERLDLTDYELGRYEKSKNVRWESTLSFWSISPVKAGWLVKQKGLWSLTPEGKEVSKLSDEAFARLSSEKYKEWKNKQQSDGDQVSLRTLELHGQYDRESVQKIFNPGEAFTPQAGSWGLHGIVRVPNTNADYVFFMTYGQSQSGHDFDESISTTGVVTWQSQPRQSLDDKRIQQFIHHDERIDSIHLFLRTSRYKAYTYLGLLRYLDHDSERSQPVWFHWELIDGVPDQKTLDEIELNLVESGDDKTTPYGKVNRHDTKNHGLLETSPPEPKPRSKTTRDFRASKGRDYAEIDSTNRKLGIAGELAALAYEKNRLIKAGRSDLADRVRHTSVVLGDGAGYDIDSFDESGNRLFIEVKTTRQGKFADFQISPNEIVFSTRHPSDFALYRIYEFNTKTETGNFYVIQGDLTKHLDLKPTGYSARLAQR